MTATIPTFGSLAESRDFFAANPHLNPTKADEKATHDNASYVKSKGARDYSPWIPDRPHAIKDVFLQEQFDEEGDTVWALWGRGLSLTTYSIREVEHELSTVMTADELHAARARRASLRSLVVRLDGDGRDPIPAELETSPALEVVATEAATEYLGHRIEVTAAEVIAYTPDGVELARSKSMAAVRLAVRRNRAEQDEQHEQLALGDGWKPASDHPWRKPKQQEVAA